MVFMKPRNFTEMRARRSRVTRAVKTLQKRFRGRQIRKKFPRKSSIYNKKPSYNLRTEQKFLPCAKKDEVGPLAIQTLAKAYYCNILLGNTSPTSYSESSLIEGTRITQGDANNQRNGDKVYLTKTILSFNIDMLIQPNNSGESHPILEFRTIVYKAKFNFDSKELSNPFYQLLLDLRNHPQGPLTSGINGTDLMMQPVNHRNFIILKDIKYKMTPPSITEGGGSNGHFSSGFSAYYPSMKNFKFYLPHNKLTEYSDVSPHNPTNYNPQWGVITFARATNKETTANFWEWNCRGTTCFRDP